MDKFFHATNMSLLTRYSAAAAALTASTAAADIKYSGPVNMNVALGSSLTLDFDNSGSSDLRLKNYSYSGGSYEGAFSPLAGGSIVSFRAGNYNFAYAFNLTPGTAVGGSSQFANFAVSLAYGLSNPNAQFNTANPGYLGFKFVNGASTSTPFYGWARVNINNSAGTFTLVDWAYQTTAGVSINAGAVPEPSSAAALGLLAAGAAGLALYRRQRSVA